MADNFEKYADLSKKKRLIASKTAWNLIVNLLRAKLLAFKSGINGHGDERAHLPEMDIKDPFPVEFHTYLAGIVDDYDKVLKGADFIMNLQDEFSNTRRKGKRELRELAAELDLNEFKIAEASWWGSRTWAWFALHRLGKDARKTRLRMLNLARKSTSALNTIEYYFTSSSPGTDIQAVVGLTRFINIFITGFLPYVERLKEIDKEGMPEDDKQLPEGSKPEPGSEEIGNDIAGGPPPDDKIKTIAAQVDSGLPDQINRLPGGKEKLEAEEILKKLKAYLKQNLKTKKRAGSDEDIIDAYETIIGLIKSVPNQKDAQTEEEEYRKIAQNVVKRWLSRKRLEFHPNKAEDLKIQISDLIRKTVVGFKELMDEIENLDRGTSEISDKVDEIKNLLKLTGDKTIGFADDYRMTWRMIENPKERPARLEENITSKLNKLIKVL